MPRFDLVVANRDRVEIFWESLPVIKDFNPKQDRIVILDCSDNPQKEFKKCLYQAKKYSLALGENLIFVGRRNWNMNHGTQLDYVRLIASKIFKQPQFTFFVQDHYLNKNQFVKGDTIPEDEDIELREIKRILLRDKKIIWFCARNGFRISARFIEPNEYYDNQHNLDLGSYNLVDVSLVIDGGNFCIRTQHLVDIYNQNKKVFTEGDGSWYFCHVWETRLSKIYYLTFAKT